jgi:tRNA modification GTPase
MYNPADTIVAISSPSNDHRVIVRITGPQTFEILNQVFTPTVCGKPGITSGRILNLDSVVYLFRQPHSYTGDDLAEIHLWANASVTEALMEQLLALGARSASAGEFTARAYFNNKIDLAQAEAVNGVITASNTFQLAAAENLLAGQFGRTKDKISSTILDLLSRLEADLDFSTEDIEQVNTADTIKMLNETINQLKGLLAGSVHCESTLDLPAVGIAGAPNAGKSTVLNKLLGRHRSIVSDKRKTTRDVLTGELTIHGCRCILLDCAGLTTYAETILDELAQQTAIEALRNSLVVIFCVDIAKTDWSEDLAVWNMFRCHCERPVLRSDSEGGSEAISPVQKTEIATACNPSTALRAGAGLAMTNSRTLGNKTLIAIATKTDLLSERDISERISKLKSLFGCDFLPVSAHTGAGIDKLKAEISELVITATSGHSKYGIALTARHKQAVTGAIADLVQAVKELKAGNDEIATMMLRTAHNTLSNIEQHNLDEQLLDRIFSRFCIGK